MTQLAACGVGLSLDDFGTRYSSLTVRNDEAIAKMIITLGDSLGLTVIAEGVETDTQKDALARLGYSIFQGFLFSRPLPVDEFEKFAMHT
jgi:EAL domain-containing protein (putative c-di-GMP-specific phosphodiesterase class I)